MIEHNSEVPERNTPTTKSVLLVGMVANDAHSDGRIDPVTSVERIDTAERFPGYRLLNSGKYAATM
jgi:hypothetical protein